MTTFVIGDIHVPFQDENALDIVYRLKQYMRPSQIIINGDLLDFRELSHFTRDKLNDRPIEESTQTACEIITKLQQKRCEVILHMGNHEARLQKYMYRNAPELEYKNKFEKHINDELKKPIKIVKEIGDESMHEYFDRKILIGHFKKALQMSAYTVRALVDKYSTNIIQSHTHRLGSHYKTTHDTVLQGHECGCLCSMSPEYVKFPNWQQGFIIVQYNGILNIETVKINDGQTLFRGRVFK